MKFNQISTFIAVFEEGSFTAAAERENATQSGLSMHIKELEHDLGTPLFTRSRAGVMPTSAGKKFYTHAVRILRDISIAKRDVEAFGETVSGAVVVGLMPTFTRAVLAPVLKQFATQYPDIQVKVVEAYSSQLEHSVAAGELDLAVVPSSRLALPVTVQHLASDIELFVTRKGAGPKHLTPVKLTEIPRLKLVLPGQENARRAKINAYIKAYGLDVESVLEMDSMLGTLEIVASSDWVTILPAILCLPDIVSERRSIHPIAAPAIPLDYAIISSKTEALSQAATLFAEAFSQTAQQLITQSHLLLESR